MRGSGVRRLMGACCAALIGALVFVQPALAQSGADAMGGFSMDSDEPVHIESDELEVRDRERLAVFSGNVVVRQGDTTLRTPRLEVHYTAEAGVRDAVAEPAGGQSISRLEASGGVVVETGDQKATGDWASFVMASQEITMGGEVVLSQGKNVLRGERLVVHLESGTSRLISSGSSSPTRVQGLFIPGSIEQKQD